MIKKLIALRHMSVKEFIARLERDEKTFSATVFHTMSEPCSKSLERAKKKLY